ncbi:Non-histone chromosomal protein 6 [Vanrija albida]|uniref:Non-histone chromosomal protein 6 n=1 Tax=Vanrija albida TaxID=181172 RepID=A0ABR3Q081_9TREE
MGNFGWCGSGTHQTTMPKVSAKDSKKVVDTKAKRGKKDPNKPKRALSAYMFFVQDWRERIKSENVDAGFGDVGRLLGAKWKEMSDAEKKPYEDKAHADKDRAAREKAAYDASNGKKPRKAKAPVQEDDDDESD